MSGVVVEQRNVITLWAMLAGTTRAQSIVPRRQRQRPPLLRREARVPMPGPRCAATRTSLLHTSLLHCSRDSRPVRLRSVPGQRRHFNNVAGQDFWVAPAEKVDLAALAALYEKWGWDATLYDGAE